MSEVLEHDGSAESKRSSPGIRPPSDPGSPVGPAVRWEVVTSAHWMAFRGSEWVGSVVHVGGDVIASDVAGSDIDSAAVVGSYIATDQNSDVLGAFQTQAEAQRAIEAPEPSDGDLIRRRRHRQLRRHDRVRLAVVAVLATAALAVALVAFLLLIRTGA